MLIPTRVLVVEDFATIRRLLCSMLQERADLEIAGEVSDGLDAVQAAQAIQPDLILLDIDLPTISGIEAAKRIRAVSPASKIVFISGHRSRAVIEEASSIAAGYILKTDVTNQLMSGLTAVLEGRRFVSSSVRESQS